MSINIGSSSNDVFVDIHHGHHTKMRKHKTFQHAKEEHQMIGH